MLPSATPSRCPQRPLSRGESSFFSLPCALSARGPSAHGGACPRRARGLCRDRNATMRNTVASGTDRQRASGAHTTRTAPRTHTLRASGGAGNARHSFGADCLRSPTSYIRRPALRAQALSTLSAHRAPWLGAGCACFLSVGDMTGIRVQRISGSCPQSSDTSMGTQSRIAFSNSGYVPELPRHLEAHSSPSPIPFSHVRWLRRPAKSRNLFRSGASGGSTVHLRRVRKPRVRTPCAFSLPPRPSGAVLFRSRASGGPTSLRRMRNRHVRKRRYSIQEPGDSSLTLRTACPAQWAVLVSSRAERRTSLIPLSTCDSKERRHSNPETQRTARPEGPFVSFVTLLQEQTACRSRAESSP